MSDEKKTHVYAAGYGTACPKCLQVACSCDVGTIQALQDALPEDRCGGDGTYPTLPQDEYLRITESEKLPIITDHYFHTWLGGMPNCVDCGRSESDHIKRTQTDTAPKPVAPDSGKGFEEWIKTSEAIEMMRERWTRKAKRDAKSS